MYEFIMALVIGAGIGLFVLFGPTLLNALNNM